jgi:hypothetical protein
MCAPSNCGTRPAEAERSTDQISDGSVSVKHVAAHISSVADFH